MYRKVLVYLFIFVGFSLLYRYFPVDYSYESLKSYLLVLLAVSSMVFTLMAIWIALLYPNALFKLVNSNSIENADFSDAKRDTKRLEMIVGAVLKSALVVLSVLFLFFIELVFSEAAIVRDNLAMVKSITLSAVSFFSYLQIESVFSVIFSNVMFINDLHSKKQQVEADDDF